VYKKMMNLSRTLALAVLLAVCLPAPAVPAKEKEEKPAEPVKTIRVAVMPLMNRTQEALADQVVNEALREQLKEFDAARALFLLPNDVERVLAAHNAYPRAGRIADRWSRDGKLDSTAVAGLDTLLSVDAVLCVKVSDWEMKRVTVINAGQSYTTVGLEFALFDVREKKLIWKKSGREQRYADEYDVTSGAVSYDETGTIQSRRTNEPPRPKDVTVDIIKSAFRKFPRA
jgi:hypothetical protein